jgi:membrane fusion protein, multidrug efflux system
VATGTVHLKATFDNSDERLWPGEFVSAHLIVSTRTNAITVPSQAVLQGANGAYVYVIKPDDTAERRSVDVALTQRGVAVLDKGVSVGERVVVEGQHRLTDGAKLKIDTSQQAALGQEQQRQ